MQQQSLLSIKYADSAIILTGWIGEFKISYLIFKKEYFGHTNR
jgi:hypothetical protein